MEGKLVGLKMHSTGTVKRPGIAVDVFLEAQPTQSEEKKLKTALATKLGANTDLTDFYALAKNDSILSIPVNDLYGMRNTQFGDLFGAATLAISLQMAPIKRSNQMQNCLIKRFGETASFDGRKIPVWPTARRIARADSKVLFADCKLGYRAKFLVKLAQMIAGGFPSLEELAQLPAEDARKKIMELPGIGDYSADIINPHGGFSIDVWSADIFGKIFFGKKADIGRSSIARIKAEGIRRWGKWARLAFVYIVHDLPHINELTGLGLRLA